MDKTEKLIDELINKWIKANWLNDLSHPQVYIMAKGIEDVVNHAQQPLIDELEMINQRIIRKDQA